MRYSSETRRRVYNYLRTVCGARGMEALDVLYGPSHLPAVRSQVIRAVEGDATAQQWCARHLRMEVS